MRPEMFGEAKPLAVAAVALIMIYGAVFAQQRQPDTVLWTDSTKDVHVNGELDRAAQVPTSDETRRIVLISPKLERAAVLIGIGRGLREPAEAIRQRNIVRVPTVIVERDGVELGRIVENPAAKTIEEDLAAILSGAGNTGKHE